MHLQTYYTSSNVNYLTSICGLVFSWNWPVKRPDEQKILLSFFNSYRFLWVFFSVKKWTCITYLCKKSGSEPCSDSGSWICSPMGRLFSRKTVDVSCGVGKGPGVWIMVSVLFSHVLSRLSSVKFQLRVTECHGWSDSGISYSIGYFLKHLKSIFYWLCYYSCPISPHPFIPLCPATPPPRTPPNYFMSMGCTYKFFGFSISHTTLNLPVYFVSTIYATYSLYLFPRSLPTPPCW